MVSLEHLVDHYMRFSDGLPIQIRNPLSIKAQLPPKVPSPIRNQITGWVPLHEAAWNGHIDCAKILLQWDSPVMSRTPKV